MLDYMTGPLVTFFGLSVLVIVVPGPDTAVTIRSSLLGGRAAGLATAAGVAGGQAIWALVTAGGLVALLVASESLFLAVKYAGAAYLVWLGVQALRAAIRPTPRSTAADPPPVDRLTPRRAFFQGLVSNLGNPKMAVFFTSLLPQFTPAGVADFAGLAALGLLFNLTTLLWLASYALAVARLGDVLRRPAMRRAIEGVAGAALVGFGIKLASDGR